MGPLLSLYEGRTATTGTPSVTLNTPADAGSVSSTTPTLDFTGVTSTGDQSISYEIEVDSVNTFDSQISTPAVVQTRAVEADTLGATSTAAFTSNNTAGNLLIAAISLNVGSTSTTVASVTDSQGNTWNPVFSNVNDSGSNTNASLYYAANCKVGANTLTINYGGGTGNASVAILREYSGIATTSPLDKSTTGTGNSTALSSGATAATTQAHELVIGVGWTGFGTGQTYAAGAGYGNVSSGIFTSGFGDIGIEDKLVSSTGAQTAAFTTGSSWNWGCGVATFKSSSTPLIDKLSATDVGFADITNGAKTDPFPSSDQIGYTVQAGNALTTGNTYYWRVQQAIPTNNVNYLSGWSATHSFTVSSGSTLINVSDSATTTENVALQVTSFVNKSDNLTTTENVVLQELSFVNKSDTATTTENVQVAITDTISVSDSLTTTENLKLLSEANVNKSDTLTTTESVTVLIPTLLVSVSDASTITESTQKTVVSFINVSDSSSITDSLVVQIVDTINLSDSSTITENVQLLVTSFVNVSDTATTTESLQRLLVSNIATSDSLTTTESVALTDTLNITVSDASTISENLAEFITTLLVSVSDSSSVSETIQPLITSFITTSDSSSLTESLVVQRQGLLAIQVSDSITTTENIGVVESANLVVVNDTVTTAESLGFSVTVFFAYITTVLNSDKNTDTMQSENNSATVSSGDNTDTLQGTNNTTALNSNSNSATLSTSDNNVTLD